MKNTREKNGLIRNAASVFWNFNQGRLRALWRILGALICTAILTFIFGAPFFAASGAGPAPYIEKIVLYIAALVSVYAATRFLDKRKFSDTGIYMQQDWWIDLGFGLFLGALLMTIIFFVELAAGWITITDLFYTPNPNQPFLVAILLPVILLLIVGIVEELLFRGYLLLNLAEGFNLSVIGPRWAIILSWLLTSAIFGFAHAISPNATIISSVYIALIAVWLGLGYVLTGSLAIPIGIHLSLIHISEPTRLKTRSRMPSSA